MPGKARVEAKNVWNRWPPTLLVLLIPNWKASKSGYKWTFSNWIDVGSGVPQGSLLGPILFLLFVNDMPNVINSATLAMFADDSKCYRIINNDADFSKLQQDLVSLTTWSLSNELYFQPTKCSNLRISRKRISSYRSYSINGIDVEVVSTEKDLGVVIVNDTSWEDHMLMIVAKANRLLGFIRRSCAVFLSSVALSYGHLSLLSAIYS